MIQHDTKPWVCCECHYEMDTTTNVTDDTAPKEGDFCMCLNCGAVYEYDWQLRPQSSNFLNPVIIAAVEMIKRRGRLK
jgi:succinate dehydrogenase/fumarate reductase-like Fe-S protein